MSRATPIIIAAVILAGGAAAWLLARAPADSVGVAPGADTPAVPAAELPLPAGTTTAETPQGEPPAVMSPAKRIRHGTAAEPGPPSTAGLERPPSGNEKVDRLNDRVEKALAGDIDELLGLARLISECRRGMGSEEQLQQRLDRAAQFQSRNPGGPAMPGRGAGGSVEYRSFEDMETRLWAQFDECQVSREVLDETLYEQVARLAEAGVPSARYLYSVWPPGRDAFDVVDTLALLEYQSLALEYTWANLQERDPLGLLAMSQSYSARRPSMFTPTNGIQGQVFLLAAMKCGVDNEWLEQRSVEFGQGFSRFQARNTEMPSLEEDAAALADMFCPVADDQ